MSKDLKFGHWMQSSNVCCSISNFSQPRVEETQRTVEESTDTKNVNSLSTSYFVKQTSSHTKKFRPR